MNTHPSLMRKRGLRPHTESIVPSVDFVDIPVSVRAIKALTPTGSYFVCAISSIFFGGASAFVDGTVIITSRRTYLFCFPPWCILCTWQHCIIVGRISYWYLIENGESWKRLDLFVGFAECQWLWAAVLYMFLIIFRIVQLDITSPFVRS